MNAHGDRLLFATILNGRVALKTVSGTRAESEIRTSDHFHRGYFYPFPWVLVPISLPRPVRNRQKISLGTRARYWLAQGQSLRRNQTSMLPPPSAFHTFGLRCRSAAATHTGETSIPLGSAVGEAAKFPNETAPSSPCSLKKAYATARWPTMEGNGYLREEKTLL
jgi:hypothetical protein